MHNRIRTMKTDEISQVQHVAKTSWNSTYDGIIPADIQNNFLKTAYSDEQMKHRLKSSLFLIAEVNGEIVGFANFSPVNDIGQTELGAIYILPEHQGLSIGTDLLHEGLKLQPDAKEVFISVEKDNDIGKHFYEAKGFKIISEFEEDFDGHLLQTIRMVLKVR
ncbi:GNAT family N-acetyltransferase [Lentibacillus sp. L22]|uniref:GNAT family N-acetyltransferase n=1 Tax=Lentibacillus sp. L22 TaxID=3163028 RepID=UPI003465234E